MSLIHPKHHAPGATRALLTKMQSVAGTDFAPDAPIASLTDGTGGDVIGFTIGPAGAIDVYCTSDVSRASHLVVLRIFLRLQAVPLSAAADAGTDLSAGREAKPIA